MDIVMGLFGHLRELDFNEVIMVALTFIACSAYSQARSAKRQARYAYEQAQRLEEAEQRIRERDEPKIRFSSVVKEAGEKPRLVGFSITNASPFAVTLTSFNFELGIPVNSTGNVVTETTFSKAVMEREGIKLSDASFPHRLQYGETIRVLYDADEFVNFLDKLRLEGELEHPARIRPICYDSLGNRHRMKWISWSRQAISYFDDPGPGLVTKDEWFSKQHRDTRMCAE